MRLHRFAILTAVTTFVLLIVGGLVHGTGSSLACPDWPLCHGSLMPKMEKGVEYEHTHRLVAGLVAILTIALGVLIFLDSRYRSLRWLAVAAPVMVLVQAVLGGITVLYRLPKPITLSHLTLSMVFFSVLIILALRTRPADTEEPKPAHAQALRGLAGLRFGVGLTALAVLGQITLGGLVRHSMAGLACITFPFCFGNAWPPDSYSEQVHMLHRYGAVIVATLVVIVSVAVHRRARGIPGLRGLRALAVAAPTLVLVQGTLGVLSVTTLLHLPTVTAHLGVGALLLGSVVAMWTLTPSRAPSAAPTAPSLRDSADLPDAAREGAA
jgi:heme A synthase